MGVAGVIARFLSPGNHISSIKSKRAVGGKRAKGHQYLVSDQVFSGSRRGGAEFGVGWGWNSCSCSFYRLQAGTQVVTLKLPEHRPLLVTYMHMINVNIPQGVQLPLGALDLKYSR